MSQSSGGQAPIPPARKDDSEDVAWALSTAEAMFARGDKGDALKWLRRAAESASEAQADDRALELAKAAADLAQVVAVTASMPPPAPPVAAPPARPAASVAGPSRPPPPPPAPRGASPVATSPAARTAAVAAPPRAAGPSSPPPAPARVAPTRPMTAITPAATPAALSTSRPVAGAAPARTPARSPSPTSVGLGPRPAEPRKAARRSRPDIDLVRRTDGPQDRVEQTLQDLRVPSPTGSQRRRARSRPSADEVPPTSPDDTGGQSTSPDAAPSTRTPSRSDEIDAWPTESLSGGVPPGDPDDDPPDEKTRIGVPAYEASARMATVASEASSPAIDADPSLPVAQALRVLVWRAADGVRVAPAGTRVSAPTIEAVLVALDASADLAAWLAGK